MKISPKFTNLKSGYFNEIRPLVKAANAIDLAEGSTGYHCSDKLIELVKKHLSEGLNQYAPAAGELLLRRRVASKVNDLYGRKYDPETEITITAGVSQSIFTAISALVQEGDEVIVFEPAAEYYVSAIEMNGAQAVFVPMKNHDFHIDWEEVQKIVSTQTRMLILNTPHNPTGWVMSEIDMIRLQRIINGTKIIILSDETFEHMVFDGESHQSVALYPKLAERSVIVSSFGETYHVTGWQIGCCLAPRNISQEFRKVHQVMMYSVNSPYQLALAEFMENKDEYSRLGAFYQQRRDTFLSLMEGTSFKPLTCKGTFFQLFSYESISDEKDYEFALRLIKEYGVATVPLSIFCHEKSKRQILRFNFAKPDDVLKEAVSRLSTL